MILDDGAVVYLNGTEVLRVRMGSGNIGFGTFAAQTVSDAVLEGPFSLPADALVVGENVLAVEVHQTNANSSDVVFGLSLVADSRGSVAATPGSVNSISVSSLVLPSLWLNEVQPVNGGGLMDGQGDSDPWIEIYNSSDETLSLDDLYLSNDYGSPLAWAFPAGARIGAGEYRVVWVDGDADQSSANEWHTNFRIDPESGAVVLSQRSESGSDVVDYLNYESVGGDRSYGAFPNGSPNRRESFFVATPGEANVTSVPQISVAINEWMADNVSTIVNPIGGAFDDWFELYNSGDSAVDLSGYFLSDDLDNLQSFEIPSGAVIQPREFMLVWAGGDASDVVEQGALQVGFRLSSGGELLTLSGADGTIVDQVVFLAQGEDVSQGRLPDGNPNRIGALSLPSPGQPNVVEGGPNLPPLILPLPAVVVDEGERFELTVGAFDPDGTPEGLRFELGEGAPMGAMIDPRTGLVSWLTGELHGPGIFTLPVTVIDGGVPSMSASASFSVRVNEVNQRPVLGSVLDQVVEAGSTLTVALRAVDSDLPAQNLRYSLEGSTPADARVDPVSGEVSWSPSSDQALGEYPFQVRVEDDGEPALSMVRSFTVIVTEPTAEVKLVLVPSDSGEIVFEWQYVPGVQYAIQWIDDVNSLEWNRLGFVPGDGSVIRFSDSIADEAQRFYRVVRANR